MNEKLGPFFDKLKLARERLGLSQRGLSERLGLGQAQISRIENAAVDPQFSNVVEFARAVGLEIVVVPTELVKTIEMLERELVPSDLDSSETAAREKLLDAVRALQKAGIINERSGLTEVIEEIRLRVADVPMSKAANSAYRAFLRDLNRALSATDREGMRARLYSDLRRLNRALTARPTEPFDQPAYRLGDDDE